MKYNFLEDGRKISPLIRKIMNFTFEADRPWCHRLSTLSLVAFLTASPLVSGQRPNLDQFDSVRTLIHRQLTEESTPSIAVAVAQHGKIIWEEGFGWANREERVPANENTMYSLASISKPFTATGLMTLVEAGKIELDKPINDYLGNSKLKAWAGDATQATVRRVANHSSGLPLHYQFFFSNEGYPTPSYDDTILRYGNLVTVPGEHYQYSNLGYGILGYVLSRVSGYSYPDFMRSAVFLKLGLTHTSVNIGPGLEKFQAIRYDNKGDPIPFYDFDHPGASAIYSSAHDLVRFGMFHLKDHLPDQDPILSDTSIDAMHQPTMKTSNQGGYGIGWSIADRPAGYRVVEHSGGMPGVSTQLILVPAEDIAVVVLLNGRGHSSAVADAILKTLLPKWQIAARTPDSTPPPFHPDRTLLGTWKGTLHTYQRDLPVTITIAANGNVHTKFGQQLESLLNEAQFKDGELTGRAWGDVGTDDAARHQANTLLFGLTVRGDVLSGPVTAMEDRANPVALTQWLELKRQQ